MKTLVQERDRTEVRRRLRALRPDSQARWGRMSAHQMVCHLGDSFRLVTGEKAAVCTGGWFNRTIVKGIALYAPLRWPTGLPTSREFDQDGDGTQPIEFAADLRELEVLIERATQRTAFDQLRHPFFGVMSGRAWFRWCYLHLDHHLRQFGV